MFERDGAVTYMKHSIVSYGFLDFFDQIPVCLCFSGLGGTCGGEGGSAERYLFT